MLVQSAKPTNRRSTVLDAFGYETFLLSWLLRIYGLKVIIFLLEMIEARMLHATSRKA